MSRFSRSLRPHHVVCAVLAALLIAILAASSPPVLAQGPIKDANTAVSPTPTPESKDPGPNQTPIELQGGVTPQPPASATDEGLYLDSLHGFSFSYPKTWKALDSYIVDVTLPMWEMRIVAPTNYYVAIVVTVEELGATVKSVEEFAAAKRGSANVPKAVEIGGLPAIRIDDGKVNETYLTSEKLGYVIALQERGDNPEHQDLDSASGTSALYNRNVYSRLLKSLTLDKKIVQLKAPPPMSIDAPEADADSFRKPLDGGSEIFGYAGRPTFFGTGVSPCFQTQYTNLYHQAEDWRGTYNTPVKAVANGWVDWYDSNYSTWPGRVVIIRHRLPDGSTIYSLYGHLGSVYVASGQEVTKGQTIGTVGYQTLSNGADNSHLHWEMRTLSRGPYPCTNTRPEGRGYSYPQHPNQLGFSDPSDYVNSRPGGPPPPPPSCTPGANGVVLYEHLHAGRCITLIADHPDFNQLGFNDIASSIKFVGSYASGWEAVLYEHTYYEQYGGVSSTFRSDDSDFGNDAIWHDRASSIRIRRVNTDPGSCPGQYRAEYYNNVALSGSPTFVRCENWPISQNWGNGGPGNGVGNDNFSVRWTGRANIAAGNYTFIARADDGIRVWLDNALIPELNAWRDQGPTTYTVTRGVSSGDHDIKVEYYERGGGAVAEFRWQAASAPSDPDDGRGLSTPSSSLTGTINPNNDVDTYEFIGATDLVVTIRMSASDASLDSYLKVFAPNNTLVAYDDDNGGGSNGRDALIQQVRLPQTGRYRIEASSYNGSSSGRYTISLQSNNTSTPTSGYWTFRAKHSNKCLEVYGNSTSAFAEVVQWDCHGGNNQQWRLEAVGNHYKIVSRVSGMCLDVLGAAAASRVSQYSCHGADNQLFRMEPVGNYYKLVPKHSGQCVDVNGASTANRAGIIQWHCNGGDNQLWLRVPVSTPNSDKE
jgi:murein DD-endopeptidase MepM/ murein hydrolase activator NlpD